MRLVIFLAAIIIQDGIIYHTNQTLPLTFIYTSGTASFVVYTAILFFIIDIYELTKK